MEIKCSECDKSFEIKPKRYNENRKHGQIHFCCSSECKKKIRDKKNKEIVDCIQCGNKFTRDRNVKRKKKCCSQKCANTYSQQFCDYEKVSESLKKYYSTNDGKIKRGILNEKLKKYKNCPNCNKQFYGTKKYCSILCMKSIAPSKISETRKEMFGDGKLEVTGGTTKWLTYKDIRVQGSYEYRTCIILDKLKELGLITDWHRSNFRIKYIGTDGEKHSYLIDFEIITKSGRILYLETKGYIQDKDLLKWAEMKKQSYKLIVWMCKHLDQIENKLKI